MISILLKSFKFQLESTKVIIIERWVIYESSSFPRKCESRNNETLSKLCRVNTAAENFYIEAIYFISKLQVSI